MRNARRLLASSAAGANPFEGLVPSIPTGDTLDYASDAYRARERDGARAGGAAGFVLVAGGLGERLGYTGVKLALPVDTARGACFLQEYCECILALQDKAGQGAKLPLAIMTSGDTHAATEALLKDNDYFGMVPEQVTLLKQEKVACLADGAATLALSPGDRFTLLTKPHGHGDVHALMHASGTAARWAASGTRWLAFFQDTNGAAFRGLLPALGVSAARRLALNSVCVPRRAGEAIGAIATLTPSPEAAAAGATPVTVNVEYNVLDPLLKAAGSGDVDDPGTGYSPYPGNINQLVVAMDPYLAALEATGGVVAEFVNPKYADATRTAFKAPTRLECMMQDLPHALPPGAAVGFTVINQVWAAYSPVKNSLVEAAAKAAAGAPTHSAAAAEADAYRAAGAALTAAGVVVPSGTAHAFKGVPVTLGPILSWSPRWALTLDDVAARFPTPDTVKLAPGCTLVVRAPAGGVVVKALDLDGALTLDAAPGARVSVDGLAVRNAGWEPIELSDDKPAPEELRMRGFKLCRRGTLALAYAARGDTTVAGAAGAGGNADVAPAAVEGAALAPA